MTQPFAVSALFNGVAPIIQGPLALVGQGAAVLGRATLGHGAWLDDFAVIRADGHFVEIGSNFFLGVRGTVHIAHDLYPTRIGDHVSVGANAIVHACTVADDCVIDRDAIVLDGAMIGPGAALSAGAVVFPRTELEGGWLYTGSPARPISRLSAEDLETHHLKLRNDSAKKAAPSDFYKIETADTFIAPTASVQGDVRCGAESIIWYGCRLTAGSYCIDIGARTNIQDNSTIACKSSSVTIAQNVTVGHNVTLADCQIEANSLIGMGATISPGTIVESGVLVAGGAETEVGQRLTGGQVWAGRPARPIGQMNAQKRQMLAGTLPVYCSYAEHFRKTAHHPISVKQET